MMDEAAKIAEREHRDHTGSKMGMWFFLITELFFFVGPFLLYAVYRYRYATEFRKASSVLNLPLAAINTVVLLTSSLTMTLSISSVKRGSKRMAAIFLAITAILGVIFMSNKYVEWHEKISHGIYPGSQDLLMIGRGEALFYSLYFFMTGLHGLHVAGGIILIVVMMVLVIKEEVHQDDVVKLENSGLYWHLVDIIWIYLFPLFYLIS